MRHTGAFAAARIGISVMLFTMFGHRFDYPARQALSIERADSRDRGSATGNKDPGGSGRGTASTGQQQGQRPMQIDPLGQIGPVPQGAPNPFATGGGFALHPKATGGTPTGAAALPPGAPPAVPNQRVYIDPYTLEPYGTMPQGQMTIGGPARAYPENQDTNLSQSMAQSGTVAPGSIEAARALQAQHYYEMASKEQNAPGLGGFLKRNMNMMGFEQAPVQLDQPATYAGGSTQLGLNPAGLAGGVAGAATGLPMVGTLAGAAYTGLGGRDLIMTGPDAFSPTTGQPAPTFTSERSLPPGFRATGGTTGPVNSGAISAPSSTPSATLPSTASQPVQNSPAQQQQNTGQTGLSAVGQQAPGGRTVISGSNSVSWPWSTINA
jgi:hypothetical protein